MMLLNGNCLELLEDLPDASVDMVLTDPPYGTTACKWDTVIPFEPMWKELKRVTKPNSAILLFSKQPFTTALNASNLKDLKQELIWIKDNHDNPMMAKRKHLNVTENISVFYRAQANYKPQGIVEINKITKQGRGGSIAQTTQRAKSYLQTHTNYPNNVLKFNRDRPQVHPTQKPVALLEYLIKTYTNEGDTVLDFTMGSGSTGVAAKNLNRKFVGIELSEEYFEIARKRINNG